MIFSSLIFVFIFLPIVIILYFLAKEKYRNYILLIASLLFYSYGEPWFVSVMILSIVANYVLALLIDKTKQSGKNAMSKFYMITSIVINIGLLCVFKYLSNLLNGLFDIGLEIVLPIGISFFTFQALSYVIDVYRGNVSVQKNPFHVALYISFFPQLIAGPIVRYSSIEAQLYKRVCSIEKFAEGVRRFFLGFAKKVILANNLSVVVSGIWTEPVNEVSVARMWIASICFSLQIYYDFSGYSDMAIGLGKMFGFEIEENFNYPYISASVTEFWNRWHISLGHWLRDYVYIPLGGSRVGVPRYILNVFIVWLLSGIWHGAGISFIAWGLIFFALLVVEKFIVKPKQRNVLIRVLWRIIILIIINFSWVIFNSTSLSSGIGHIKAMIGLNGNPVAIDAEFIKYFREYGAYLVIGIICATPIVSVISKKIEGSSLMYKMKAIASPILYGIIFAWSVSFLILGAHNPFLYFNF